MGPMSGSRSELVDATGRSPTAIDDTGADSLTRAMRGFRALMILAEPASVPGMPPEDEIGLIGSLATIFRARLTTPQLRIASRGCLVALDCEEAEAAAMETLEFLCEGAPLPPLFSARIEARSWAALAPLEERRTFLVEILKSLPPKDRCDFLEAASRKARS